MGIPIECKRLAEVDFPVARVSSLARAEKYIHLGHPSTLHIWWARRPLASSRAMLMALLLPDPCDPHCPTQFKTEVRRALLDLRARPMRWEDQLRSDEGLRQALLEFIGDFANWDAAADPDYLACARGLVNAVYPEDAPLVVDPFAGGGSIPLEALRLGCNTFASDLNPVACLILKVLLEDIPKHGPKLAQELERAATEIKRQAEQELANLYPKDPDGAMPIAYLWARTVRCESPNCGAEIPLVRSFWLSKKVNRRRALKPRVVRAAGTLPIVEFEIFEPKAEGEVQGGTVSRAKATCLCCGAVLSAERVRARLSAQGGGVDVVFDAEGRRVGGARLLAVVSAKRGEEGRTYRIPKASDYGAVREATRRLHKLEEERPPGGLSLIPDEPLPPTGALGFRIQRYGATLWRQLFTTRELVVLATLASASKVIGARLDHAVELPRFGGQVRTCGTQPR